MANLFLKLNRGGHIPHIEQKFPQDYDLKKRQSRPQHPKNAGGVCFVVGTHPCVHDDILAADKVYPMADVCAINDAADLMIPDHLATCHPEKLDQFMGHLNDDVQIHTRNKMDRPKPRPGEFVWDINTGGGSALFGVVIMLAIGYDLVIMCGCPMDGGGGYAIRKHDGTIYDPRFGDLSPDHSLVQGYHGHLQRFKDQNILADRVRSMSGRTKKIFGGI